MSSLFNEDIAREICIGIATSSFGIRKLCKMHKHWPSVAVIFRWLHDNVSFREQYARAKCSQIESFIDEVIEISDDSVNDSYIGDDGKIKTSYDNIHRARLRIDTRKWLASKLCPRLYGEKGDPNKTPEEDAISKFRVDE